MATKAPLYFEPFDSSCRPTLFETYARLLEEAPVYRTESGMWTVARMDDVREIYRRTDLFSNRPSGTAAILPRVDPDNDELVERLRPVFAEMLLESAEVLSATVIVGSDPPEHTVQRNSVNRAFHPRRISALKGFIESVTAAHISEIETSDSFDVVADLTEPVPLKVICRLLGLDPADEGQFREWMILLVSNLDADIDRTSLEHVTGHYVFLKDFCNYFLPLIEERRENPGEDLISDIMEQTGDVLTAAEAILFILILMGAGSDTTTNLMGNLTVSLMTNPDQLDLVVQDPSLIPAAIEESLRMDSPFQFQHKEALVDVELSGVTIPKGSLVVPLLGAANRDPKYFEDPDRFDISRPPIHIAFGQGIHFCVGAPLARLEARTVMESLVPLLPNYELDPADVEFRNGMLIWGRKSVPIRRRARASAARTG
jgi:cytochrome P450